MNRFSWYKRTVQALGAQVSQNTEVIAMRDDMLAFQSSIGNPQFPLGMHMTGPLREKLKRVCDQRTPTHP